MKPTRRSLFGWLAGAAASVVAVPEIASIPPTITAPKLLMPLDYHPSSILPGRISYIQGSNNSA